MTALSLFRGLVGLFAIVLMLFLLACAVGALLRSNARRYPLVGEPDPAAHYRGEPLDVTARPDGMGGVIISGKLSPGMAAALGIDNAQTLSLGDTFTLGDEDQRALLLVHYLAMADELRDLAADDDLSDWHRNRCRHLAERADALLT